MATFDKVLTWILTGAGGNVQTTMLKILDKLHYCEARLMDNTAFLEDTLRVGWQSIQDAMDKLQKDTVGFILDQMYERFCQARSKNNQAQHKICEDFSKVAEQIYTWAAKYAANWQKSAAKISPPDQTEILKADAATKMVKEIRDWIIAKIDDQSAV